MARDRVGQQHSRVIAVVWTDGFVGGEKTAGQAVEEDGEVVGFADLAFCADGLAVAHECRCRLEVLEARGALHARDAVVGEDVAVEVACAVECLSVHGIRCWTGGR